LLYNVAPLLSLASVVLIWAVVPYTPYHYGVDLDIGALNFVAVSSLGTLSIMMAGWASNNKYALLGAFRVVALLVSYEIPLMFSLLIPVMLAGSMSMLDIIYAQSGMWFVFMAPLSVFLFFVSSQAETGRAPFDLIEAESELVAGFNIEYSGMKFGMFFAGEFLHVFTNGILMAVLFFGGWLGLGWEQPLLAFLWLAIKAMPLYLTSLWIRNTVPRLRIDQVMKFNWFFLVPISILNVVVMAFLLKVMQEAGIAPTNFAGASFVDMIPTTIVLFLGNVAIIMGILGRLRTQGRQLRRDADSAQQDLVAAGAAGD
jgi:NADH-quinone oxidoreductase subunit H